MQTTTAKPGNPDLRVVFYEGVGAAPLPGDTRFDAMKAMLDKGYAVTRSTGRGRVAEHDDRAMIVFARFDDTHDNISSTKAQGRGSASPWDTAVSDIALHVHRVDDSHGPAEMLATTESIREQAGKPKPGGWKPWFPVIDYKRCTNCMQCLSFCLFDVYGVDQDNRIQVQNNTNCKTDCPACSRVCPEVAILFPKYRNGPINGDEVSDADVKREQMKVDISSLLGGDIYQALRERNIKAKSRFHIERDEDKALKERMRCLSQLQGDLDIPKEVLSSLPSFDEIKAKAAAAAQKAKQALGQA